MYPTSSIGSEGIVVRVVVVILACWSSHTYVLMLITPNSYLSRLQILSSCPQSFSLEASLTFSTCNFIVLIDTSSFTHFDPRPQLSSLQIFSFFIAPSCAIPIVHRLVHIVFSVFLYRVQKRVCLQLRPS